MLTPVETARGRWYKQAFKRATGGASFRECAGIARAKINRTRRRLRVSTQAELE